MLKRFLPAVGLIVLGLALIVAFRRPHVPARNPDPNHTHVDFLVMLDGQQVDFSGDEFMTGLSTEDHTRDEELGPLRKYLHLHDGIGTVIHRHKPGLTLADFFESIHVGFAANCVLYAAPLEKDPGCSGHPWRMFVNGQERPFSLDVDFADGDKILLTTAADDAVARTEMDAISDEACRYSQTCPWRGKPPVENCIADPEVPCVVPGT